MLTNGFFNVNIINYFFVNFLSLDFDLPFSFFPIPYSRFNIPYTSSTLVQYVL